MTTLNLIYMYLQIKDFSSQVVLRFAYLHAFGSGIRFSEHLGTLKQELLPMEVAGPQLSWW